MFTYFNLDWLWCLGAIGAFGGMLGAVGIAHLKRWGLFAWLISNIAWLIYFGVANEPWPFFQFAFYQIMVIKGLIEWSKKGIK